jgi:hypothetical protein
MRVLLQNCGLFMSPITNLQVSLLQETAETDKAKLSDNHHKATKIFSSGVPFYSVPTQLQVEKQHKQLHILHSSPIHEQRGGDLHIVYCCQFKLNKS